MHDKKKERDSLENVATEPLLFSESDDESHIIAPSSTQSRLARLRRFANITTLECLLILLLLVVLSICLRLIITQNQDCTIITTDGKREGIYGVGDTDYMTRDHAKDVLWNNVSGTDLGLTWSAHGNQNGKETLGQIAMLHQLGCLASIREAIQDASEGRKIGMDWKDNDRWPHCLDYLRKTLLCLADGTIERPINAQGERIHTIQGYYDKRMCGQTDVLYDINREKGYSNYHP